MQRFLKERQHKAVMGYSAAIKFHKLVFLKPLLNAFLLLFLLPSSDVFKLSLQDFSPATSVCDTQLPSGDSQAWTFGSTLYGVNKKWQNVNGLSFRYVLYHWEGRCGFTSDILGPPPPPPPQHI